MDMTFASPDVSIFSSVAFDPDRCERVAAALREAVPFNLIQIQQNRPYVAYADLVELFAERTENMFSIDVLRVWEVERMLTTKSGIKPIAVTQALVRITVPGVGSRTHMGLQAVHDGSGEDLEKGAISDGVKKAIGLFGLASNVAAEWKNYNEQRRRRNQKPTQTRQDEPQQTQPVKQVSGVNQNRASRPEPTERSTSERTVDGTLATARQVQAIYNLGQRCHMDEQHSGDMVWRRYGARPETMLMTDAQAEIKRLTLAANIVRALGDERESYEKRLGRNVLELDVAELQQIGETD